MAFRRYLSYFASPHSPRDTHSPDFPVNAHLHELQRFWKSTYEDLLKEGDEIRSTAMMRLSSMREGLSVSDSWDLQTLYDGLVVEREELSELLQSPERLSFELVSRASSYRSRAKSLHGEVQEVVRRSQADPEAARAKSSQPEQIKLESRAQAHAIRPSLLPGDSDTEADELLLRDGSQYDTADWTGRDICESPTSYASSSGCFPADTDSSILTESATGNSWGSTDSSCGPITPISARQSAPRLMDVLSSSPDFLFKLNQAFDGLDTLIDVKELESLLSVISIEKCDPPSQKCPTQDSLHLHRPEHSFSDFLPPSRALEAQSTPSQFPFPPVPRLRRSRTAQPVGGRPMHSPSSLFPTRGLRHLRSADSLAMSPNSRVAYRSDEHDEDSFMDDLVETYRCQGLRTPRSSTPDES
ncbi:uncharacterized protein FIBRA_05330 [Fibroporia radiculosa]|uniref:Uncharacterized protein n=1 Tax=Fibroporia radiculosa TaxID=599839 RepID=J4IAN2_9APHY|nr:uncharacterized protein FIBRA_05330 [Fibroporia radiculosa]CCM03206.1 predicted protein [Fibroporia radiculosa]